MQFYYIFDLFIAVSSVQQTPYALLCVAVVERLHCMFFVGGQITKYLCTTAKPECIYIRICQTTSVLISDNLPVRKSYFDSNIIARILRRFFYRLIWSRRQQKHMYTCNVIKVWKLNTLTLATWFITIFHTAPFPIRSMGKLFTSC